MLPIGKSPEFSTQSRAKDAKSTLQVTAAAVVCALVPLVCLWGFTVDDALISARVARNIQHGAGYRFNLDGAVVDTVTPLGWAYILAPFASTARQALLAAQILGVAAWLFAAGFLGAQIARSGSSRWRFLPLGILLCNAPLAAWSVAGMETAVVIALATFALTESRWATLFAGLAAAWRPELCPWAFVLSVGRDLAVRESPRRVITTALLVVGPTALVGIARQCFFGTSVPLGLLAKPSDISHGAYYCWGALRLTGVPMLLLSLRQLWRLPPRLIAVALASAVHFAVVLALGGDWMPFFRLLAPVLPGMLLVAAALANSSSAWKNLIRGSLAALSSLGLAVALVPEARRVGTAREQLSARLSGLVEPNDRIAALDVGWIGAATEARIVDLAGLTEPRIARLPGGHTSKRLPDDFLERWRPSILILLGAEGESFNEPWAQNRFAREVEARIAHLVDERAIESVTTLDLRWTHQKYAVVRLRQADIAH